MAAASDHCGTFLQESAKAAAELARDFAPEIECKWGDAGLEEIMGDCSIMGVAVVLAGQVQVCSREFLSFHISSKSNYVELSERMKKYCLVYYASYMISLETLFSDSLELY